MTHFGGTIRPFCFHPKVLTNISVLQAMNILPHPTLSPKRSCHKPISQNNHTIFCSGRIYPKPYFVCDKSHRYIVTQPPRGEGYRLFRFFDPFKRGSLLYRDGLMWTETNTFQTASALRNEHGENDPVVCLYSWFPLFTGISSEDFLWTAIQT
jgi:hypothetical protein